MLIRPPHPAQFDPLAGEIFVPKLLLPSRWKGSARHGMGWLPCCCCDLCIGTPPAEFQIVISGVYNDVPCVDCPSLDGTYVVRRVTPPCDPDAGDPPPGWYICNYECMWVYELPSVICSGGSDPEKVKYLWLGLWKNGADYQADVGFSLYYGSGFDPSIAWYKDFGTSKIDCAGMSNTEFLMLTQGGCNITDPLGGGPNATCFVTAL